MDKKAEVNVVMTPLKDGVEYVDAQGTFEAFAKAMNEMNERLVNTEKMLELQISINTKLIENVNQLLLGMAELRNEEPSNKPGLILPPRLQ